RIVPNCTDDRPLIIHAVETLGTPSLTRISDPLALAADLSATDIATPGMNRAQLNSQAILGDVLAVLARRMRAAEEESYRGNIMTLISSFQDLARGLRGGGGRKQVLHLSAGFGSRMRYGLTGWEQR